MPTCSQAKLTRLASGKLAGVKTAASAKTKVPAPNKENKLNNTEVSSKVAMKTKIPVPNKETRQDVSVSLDTAVADPVTPQGTFQLPAVQTAVVTKSRYVQEELPNIGASTSAVSSTAPEPNTADREEQVATMKPKQPKATAEELTQIVKEVDRTLPSVETQTEKYCFDDFQIGRPLGRGRFGRVFLARTVSEHWIVALKMIFKEQIHRAKLEHQVRREIEINSHLIHPNIIKMYGWFHDDKRLWYVLEYAAGGEMYAKLQKAGHFNEHLAATYMYQITDAHRYMQKHNVIHRDVKPENILLGFEDDPKVADFGWSTHTKKENKRRTYCGTLDYIPPEMVDNGDYDNKIDNWCLGILLFEFLTGKPPFESSNERDTQKRIVELDYTFPSHVSSDAKDVISQLLQVNPEQRLELRDIQAHHFMKKCDFDAVGVKATLAFNDALGDPCPRPTPDAMET